MLINGAATGYFRITRPTCLYLFVMVMEALSFMIKRAVEGALHVMMIHVFVFEDFM